MKQRGAAWEKHERLNRTALVHLFTATGRGEITLFLFSLQTVILERILKAKFWLIDRNNNKKFHVWMFCCSGKRGKYIQKAAGNISDWIDIPRRKQNLKHK